MLTASSNEHDLHGQYTSSDMMQSASNSRSLASAPITVPAGGRTTGRTMQLILGIPYSRLIIWGCHPRVPPPLLHGAFCAYFRSRDAWDAYLAKC